MTMCKVYEVCTLSNKQQFNSNLNSKCKFNICSNHYTISKNETKIQFLKGFSNFQIEFLIEPPLNFQHNLPQPPEFSDVTNLCCQLLVLLLLIFHQLIIEKFSEYFSVSCWKHVVDLKLN